VWKFIYLLFQALNLKIKQFIFRVFLQNKRDLAPKTNGVVSRPHVFPLYHNIDTRMYISVMSTARQVLRQAPILASRTGRIGLTASDSGENCEIFHELAEVSRLRDNTE
jgi:hypothetical protein